MKNNIWVYDLETFKDIFCGVFYNTVTFEKKVFEISSRKNEWKELKKFLLSKIKLIGFNNVKFDYPVLDKMFYYNGELSSKIIYEFAQEIIHGGYSNIWNPKVPQLDLYLIHHYDNMARSTSLKYLEFSLRWKKVQDLPFKFYADLSEEVFDDVIEYCFNDVYFTHELYVKSKNAITFRINTSEKLKHNVMNYSDVKIGEYINRITYEKLSGRPYKGFKDARTYRKSFKLSDIIEDGIFFKTEYLKEFLSNLQEKIFYAEDDDSTNAYLKFAGNTFKFAKGGLHSEDKPRIVKNVYGNLSELDVASYYPASITNSKLYPAHLGVEWYNGVAGMFNRRTNEIKPLMKTLDKKTQEYQDLDTEQAGIKLSLNGGIFGKLGSVYSWQYDPMQKYRITINCQLKLLMLIEDLDAIGATIHSANTDGVVIDYEDDLKPKVLKIWKEWEDRFGYILEETTYNQIVFSSVNDYIAEITDPITRIPMYNKYKGDFEIDKDWHKNSSQRIVKIALKRYFIDGVDVKETIENHMKGNSYGKTENYGIFDFCIGKKKTTCDHIMLSDKGMSIIDDKVIRFFVSKSQTKLYKRYEKLDKYGRRALEAIAKGFRVTMFMDHEELDDYNIDYRYYINECRKMIGDIERPIVNVKQLKLF